MTPVILVYHLILVPRSRTQSRIGEEKKHLTGRKLMQDRLREHAAEQRLHDGWAWVGALDQQLSKAKRRATKIRRMLGKADFLTTNQTNQTRKNTWAVFKTLVGGLI